MTHAIAETARQGVQGRRTPHSEAERLPALRPGFCDQCQISLPAASKARHARFCSARCRERWWVKARNRGAQLYQMQLIWRMSRGRKGTRGQGMIGKVSALIDSWIRADKGGNDA